MTSLTITPNWKNKTARFKGTVAAGEHVAVSIANDDGNSSAYVASTTNLRLNVIDPATGRLLATFPQPVEEGETPEAWDSDLTPLSCELNLNTVQMLRAVPPGANVPLLFVLDDAESKTLYFKDRCDVTHWPRRVGEEEPVNLDDYKDIIKDFNDRLTDAEDDIANAVAAATSAAAQVATSAQSAADAAEAAGRAANAAASAARSQADWSQNDSTKPDFIKNKPTSLAGYGIADAKIENGAITLGENTIVPLTAHQDISGKADLVDGKVPAGQLPSYVDDVVEGYYYNAAFYEDSAHATAMTPSAGKIYVDVTSGAGGKCYRWSGSGYVEISPAPDLSPYALKSEVPSASSSAGSAPNVDGAAGESSAYARGDHKHPQETEVISAGYHAPDSWFPITYTKTYVKPGSQTPEVYNFSLTRDFVNQNAVYDSTEGEYQIKNIFGNVVLVFEREVFDPPEEGRVLFTRGAGDSGSLRLNGTAPVVGTTELEQIPQQTVKVRGVAVAPKSDIPDISGKADMDAIAPEFDSMETYHEGDLVMREGKLFICKVAEFSGEFSPSGFDPWDIADEIYDLWGETDALNEDKADRALARPLCFMALGYSTVKLAKVGTFTHDYTLSLVYSTDCGATWADYAIGTAVTLSTLGKSVMFRAKTTNERVCPDLNNNRYYNFQVTGANVEATGDLTSLLGPYADPPDALPQRCFNQLFQDCTRLVKAPELPATRLGPRCYQSLFAGCTYLTEAPRLPATELATSCYANMFLNASRLAYVDVAFTAWNPSNATTNWLSGVAYSGTFICNAVLPLINDVSHVPNSSWNCRRPYTTKEASDEAKEAKQNARNAQSRCNNLSWTKQPKWFTNPADVGHEEASYEYPDVFPLSVQLAGMDGGDILVFDDIDDWQYSMFYDQFDLRWGDSFGEHEDLRDLEVDLTGRNLLCLQINGWAGGFSGWGTLAAWDTDSGELIYRRNSVGPSDEPYALSTIPSSIVVRGGSTVPVLSYYVNQTQVHDDSALTVVFDDMEPVPVEGELREVVWELDATDVPTGSTITIVWPGTAYGAARPETGTGEDEENLVAEPGYTNVFKMFEVASDKWLVKRYLVAASLAPGDGGSSDSGLWS